MLSVETLLVASHVHVTLDILEMDGHVQVCCLLEKYYNQFVLTLICPVIINYPD